MDSLSQEGKGENKITEVNTFPVPISLGEINEKIIVTTNTPYKLSKKQLLNQAFKFHSQGNISEAVKYYQQFIDQGFEDHIVFSNYGIILKSLGKLKEAELSQRKAIKFKPDSADSHYNLGNVLRDLGKLEEAELYIRKAIELNPNLSQAHYNLGIILKDHGKLQDAKLSYRKAIALKPDYVEAYSNLGSILKDLGKLEEAELYTRIAIKFKPDYAELHSNLGNILKDVGKLQDAELSTRIAIKLKPDYAEAHYILGNILINLGKLQDAEMYLQKAIELNPDLTLAHFSLSTLQDSNKNTIWKDQIFSQSILNNKLQKDKVDIYFARANVLHKEKKYEESSRYLKLANELKLDINPSKPEEILNISKVLLLESQKQEINQQKEEKLTDSIFIVGMPRSGSTLMESILSMNTDVDDLGELNILEESFLEQKKINKVLTLSQLYRKKSNNNNEFKITTNKCLHNYQYSGIIVQNIANAKIIHCFRNPLDNILSIYRAHFAKGHEYSSSLIDCARVYLDQEKIMTEYKNRFRSNIYDLDYDKLVNNPKDEIKSLISWLGWEWDDSYLTPHLNPRSVLTASNVQVRSPINSKSIGGWKNYKEMLKPAIEIIIQADKYQNLTHK